jgi:hypothetical protein
MLLPPPRELTPEILISDLSDAVLATRLATRATPVTYPRTPGEELAAQEGEAGIPVAIITQDGPGEASCVAQERFPEARNGHKTFGPSVVGYDSAAEEIGRYLNLGFLPLILDIPPSHAELQHNAVVFEAARQRTQGLGGPSR